MKITVSDLRTDREWRSATGLDKARFEKLLPHFIKSYTEIYGSCLADRLVDTEVAYCIKEESELLLFTLFSLKSGLGYDNLGFVCGMSGSNALRNQRTGLTVLAQVLKSLGHTPIRNFLDKKDLEDYFAKHAIETLIIDATEQRIQRPGEKEAQKSCYSGKKSPHLENANYQ